MTLKDISSIRLINQQLAFPKLVNPKELVGWMGAMQAQDFPMARWAIGMRLQHVSDSDITDAYNQGKIIRTHLMRPTWHFVSADDIYWMIDLTAPQIKSGLKARHRNLELSVHVLKKGCDLIEKILTEESQITRDNLAREFTRAGIRTNENRLSHILLSAELDGIICSGPLEGNKITYSLLSKRIPQKKTLRRDESVMELMKRYFMSHGPATLKDFGWWSGILQKEAKQALELIKNSLCYETVDSEKYFWFDNVEWHKNMNRTVFLLPAYDEFLISYQDRSAVLESMEKRKIISVNGIFRPIILINGQVSGIWRLHNERLMIEIYSEKQSFKSWNKVISEKVDQLSDFLKKKVQVSFQEVKT